ncbi:MAG: aldolase [Anaerolineae bacterium]|nr:aldolase [Anaerolineae bacterium]
MNIGKLIRLNRIFSHPSGQFCSVAIDHFIGYDGGLPPGLRHFQSTLSKIVEGQPDAVTMHIGMLSSAWTPYAGKVPVIMQSIIGRPDDTAYEALATPEDAVRMGADAFAVAAYVRGEREAEYLHRVANVVHQAARFEMPVIVHIYPRDFSSGTGRISFAPEDIAWAVRCAVETGVDVVKVPYCGDVNAYAQIVRDCPVPVVAAGGPKQETLASALETIAEVVQSGAKGATIGRNVWGFDNVTAAICAFKAVIHDHLSAKDALQIAGL